MADHVFATVHVIKHDAKTTQQAGAKQQQAGNVPNTSSSNTTRGTKGKGNKPSTPSKGKRLASLAVLRRVVNGAFQVVDFGLDLYFKEQQAVANLQGAVRQSQMLSRTQQQVKAGISALKNLGFSAIVSAVTQNWAVLAAQLATQAVELTTSYFQFRQDVALFKAGQTKQVNESYYNQNRLINTTLNRKKGLW